MELRTAESKSLIRRKTVKVNTGAGSRSRQSPDATGTAFPPLFFHFSKRFCPVFCDEMKDIIILWPLYVHKRPCYILFCLFQLKSVILVVPKLHTHTHRELVLRVL